MLFQPEMIRLILADEKTQSRRVVRENDAMTLRWGNRLRVVAAAPHQQGLLIAVYRNGMLRWMEGRTYAIQPGRSKPAVARLLLEQIRYCERAAAISEDDAHAEGFDSAVDFCAYYARLNGADALDKPCWALTFHLIEAEGE